jgi:hypothetical protein
VQGTARLGRAQASIHGLERGFEKLVEDVNIMIEFRKSVMSLFTSGVQVKFVMPFHNL